MEKTTIRKKYRWQPEIATSLIYWSLTFTILFCALIVQLELIKLNPYSIILGLLFLFFLWLGLQRKLYIKDTILVIQALRQRHSQKIPIHSIREISVGTNGLTIEQELVDTTLMMKTTSMEALITEIKEHPDFKGKVRGY